MTRTRWVVHALDGDEPFTFTTTAGDIEEAEERFWNSLLGGPEGVYVVDIKRKVGGA
jgi:hypothetical protein